MANKFLIKRGDGPPASAGAIDEFELVYDYTNNELITKVGTTLTTISSGTSGTVTNVVAGNGLTGGGTSTATLDLDFSELTDMSGDISGTTEFILQNGTVESRKAASEIKLSAFNNDLSLSSGTVTSVTAGTGATHSGTNTVNPTINVVGENGLVASANAIGLDISTLAALQLNNLADEDLFALEVAVGGSIKKITASALKTYIGGGTITSVTGMTDNNVLTASGSTTISGEGSLTFDGTNLDLPNSKKIRLGDSQDLEIYHDGTNSVINNTQTGALQIYNNVDNGMVELLTDNGSGGTQVFLRADGANNMVRMPVDGVKFTLGDASDLQLYHDGSNNYLRNNTTNQNFSILVNDDGTTKTALVIDSSENALITTHGNLTVGGQVNIQDTNAIIYRNSGQMELITYGGYNIDLNPAGDVRIDGASLVFKNNAEYIYNTDASGTSTRMFGINGSNNTYIGPIDNYAGGLVLYGTNANVTGHIFYSGGAERWRITSSGTLQGNNKAITGIGGVYGNGGDLTLYNNTYNFKSSTSADLMKLTTTGLGIGTTSPASELHIGAGDSNRHIKISDNRAMFGYYGNYAVVQGGNTKGIKFNTGTDTFGSNTRMTIDSAGNVGIGTLTPDSKLEVTGSANSDLFSLEGAGSSFKLIGESGDATSINSMAYRLGLRYGSNDNGFIDFYRGPDGATGYLAFGASGVEKMRLDRYGRLGIGITDPWSATVLDLGATSNNMRTGNKIYFYDSNKYIGRSGSDIQYFNNHGNHRFYRGSGLNEIARIDSTSLIMFGTGASEGGEILFKPGTDSAYTTDFYLDSFQNKLRVHSGGAERFSVNTSGVFNIPGSLTLGTALASAYIADNAITAAKLNVSGNGTNGQVLKSDGDGTFSWFSLVSSSNAGTLDNLDSTQFLRSDANDTCSGAITFTNSAGIYINDANTNLDEGNGDSLRVTTDSGWLEVGSQNSSWGHIQTDRPKFYFNKQIAVDTGIISSYDEDLSLRRVHDSSANRIDIADGYTRIIAGNGEKFRVSSDGRVNYNGWTGVDHITVRSQGHTNSGSSSTFYIKFCTVVVDNSPAHYNGVSLSGKIYNGDNSHGNWIDWSVWFNNALDSAQITHGGFMRSNGAHWISNILVQRTAGDGEIDNGSCTYELYYDINQNWANNFYNVATEVHYTSEGKFNVTWNHDQSEITSLPGTQVVNVQSSTYDDGCQTLVQTGVPSAPSYSFLAQRNTGMYGFTDNTIGFSCNAIRMLSIKADGNLELRNDGSSQGASIQRVGGIQFTWDRDSYGTDNVHSIRSDSDNIILSSYDDVTINLDSNNNDSASTFDIRHHASSLTGGELLFQVNQSGISYTMGASQVGNGSAAAPTLSFYNDTDLGFYRRAANQIGFSTAGEEQMYLADGLLYIAQPVRFQFANDQRIFDNGSGGLSVGAESHELRLYSGGTDPIEFRTGGRNGTTRCKITYDGQFHWGSGAGHGTLTWDTGKAILNSQGSNDLEIRRVNSTDMIDLEENQIRFVADGTERFRANQNGLDLSAATANKIVHTAFGSRDKYRVWNSHYYAIGMDATYTFGGVNGYVMTFQMNNDATRGFWWGDDQHSDAQGAMSLTTNGLLTVANKIRVGFGESDTTTPASHDIVTSGSIETGEYLQIASSGVTLRRYVSSWSNATTHDVIHNGYQTTLGDYVYLKASGNTANTHGMLLNSDNYLFWGRDNLTTGAVDNSATAPMTDVCMRVDASGNALFDGDVVAYSSTIASDARLKENVEDLNYGLKDVLDMRAVSFDWIDKRNGQHDIGVIAQEIEKIIPEVVVEVDTLNSDEDTHKTVDYGKLTSVLIKAIQEQQVQIDELKTKLGE